MYKFTRIIPSTVKDLSEVWEDIELKYIRMLSIPLKDTKTITPLQQFEAYYHGCQLTFYDVEVAKTNFFMTFSDNIHLILKIGKYLETLNELQNMDKWADVVTHTGEFKSDSENKQVSDIDNKTKGGNSDTNSLVNTEYLTNMLDMNSEDPIPAHALSHTKTKEHSNVDITGKVGNTNKSTTSTSNSSRDYIESIKLQLPTLRREFWAKFRYLFTI